MIEKIRTGLWFAGRPAFWPHAMALVGRKLTNAARHEEERSESTRWAADRAIRAEDALKQLGLWSPASGSFPELPPDLLAEAEQAARSARVAMGGPADLGLLYAATLLARPRSAIETGVAYGWSSLAILSAMESNGVGQLISVDMPYVKRNNEAWVGVVVPDRLRPRWRLIRKPDRRGLDNAIAAFRTEIDLCHYDSDKSYNGRMYAYPRMWAALGAGGIFISDDIQDNFAFRDFCDRNAITFYVTESGGKFIGIARKSG